MSERGDGFNEEEVALILRRAAELSPAHTTTLEELEAVAAEAGIDRALIRRAAVEMRERGRNPAPLEHAGAFGPTRLVYERVAPAAVGTQHWSEIVAEIRRHVDDPGHIDELGNELVWSARARGQSTGRDIRVIVTPRRDKTLVRVEEKTATLAGGLYGGLMGGGVGVGLGWILPVAIAALGMPILIPVLLAAWIFGAYLLARTIHRSVVANRLPQLEALADGVAQLCVDLVPAPALEARRPGEVAPSRRQ